MSSTWVVVAHRAGARILAYNGHDEPLELLREIDHPEGRYQNKHIDTDKQGRTVSSKTNATSGYQSRVEPHDHVAQVFARHLCRMLEDGRNEHSYSNVVLVAEPRFLGMIRECLDGPTQDMITKTIPKDLGFVPTNALGKHLNGKLTSHSMPA